MFIYYLQWNCITLPNQCNAFKQWCFDHQIVKLYSVKSGCLLFLGWLVAIVRRGWFVPLFPDPDGARVAPPQLRVFTFISNKVRAAESQVYYVYIYISGWQQFSFDIHDRVAIRLCLAYKCTASPEWWWCGAIKCPRLRALRCGYRSYDRTTTRRYVHSTYHSHVVSVFWCVCACVLCYDRMKIHLGSAGCCFSSLTFMCVLRVHHLAPFMFMFGHEVCA